MNTEDKNKAIADSIKEIDNSVTISLLPPVPVNIAEGTDDELYLFIFIYIYIYNS